MPYKLKAEQEQFQVVDGPFAKKTYKHGEEYEAVPPEERHRFEKVKEPAKPRPAQTRSAEVGKVDASAGKETSPGTKSE